MKKQRKKFIEKVLLLEQISEEVIRKEDRVEILKDFTEAAIEVLEADYGYTIYKSSTEVDYKVVYQSAKAPADVTSPNHKHQFVTIPVKYGEYVHGSIVLCYKKVHRFTSEDLALSKLVGTMSAKGVTIPWLIENERKALSAAEKQKEMEILWDQEKLKTEFTENAAHELRTPLAIMKGNVDLALMDKDNLKSAQEALYEVNNEIKVLSEILENLMLINAARKDAKNLLSLQPTDLTALVKRTADRMKMVAKDKKIKIETKNLSSVLMVMGDKIYLEKLFLNLIKNAITYSPEGSLVKVKIGKENNKAKIEVSDNGMGIAPEDFPRIFERFYRGDKAHTARSIHSGLGLPIAKWAAQTHGGDIEVKSAYGKGSTFTVTLPLFEETKTRRSTLLRASQ